MTQFVGPYQLDPWTHIIAVNFPEEGKGTVLDFMNKKYLVNGMFQDAGHVINRPEWINENGLDLWENRTVHPYSYNWASEWEGGSARFVRIINGHPDFLKDHECGAFDQMLRLYEGRIVIIEFDLKEICSGEYADWPEVYFGPYGQWAGQRMYSTPLHICWFNGEDAKPDMYAYFSDDSPQFAISQAFHELAGTGYDGTGFFFSEITASICAFESGFNIYDPATCRMVGGAFYQDHDNFGYIWNPQEQQLIGYGINRVAVAVQRDSLIIAANGETALKITRTTPIVAEQWQPNYRADSGRFKDKSYYHFPPDAGVPGKGFGDDNGEFFDDPSSPAWNTPNHLYTNYARFGHVVDGSYGHSGYIRSLWLEPIPDEKVAETVTRYSQITDPETWWDGNTNTGLAKE